MKIGTLLREVWLQCGESSRPCKFDKWMRRLDGWGAEWAAGNVDRIVSWMKDEARNRGMEFNGEVARGIVMLVIRRSQDGTGSVAKAEQRSKEPTEAVAEAPQPKPAIERMSEPAIVVGNGRPEAAKPKGRENAVRVMEEQKVR